MAQVEAAPGGGAPAAAPPPGPGEAPAAGLGQLEEAMGRLGGGAPQQALLGAIREAVLQEVDARVALKTEELWARGKQAMAQLQQSHREATSRLTDEVAKCQERQRAVEAENESLRQLVYSLSSRLSALSPDLDGKHAGEDREGSTALGSSPSLTHDSPEPYAVGSSTPRSDSLAMQALAMPSEAAPELLGAPPGMPPFPAPKTPVTPGTPVLPRALDQALQPRPPAFINSLVPSAPIGLGTPVARANFVFTLRKADGVELGLHVSHHEHDKVIRVEGIKPDGAIGAWNRQWTGSGASVEKVVVIGDKIVSVNGISNDPHKMLEECKNKQLLKIEIMRGDQPPPGTPPDVPPASKATGLRADAVAFVPNSAPVASPRSSS